jgi:hypothetical protein
MNVSVFVDHQSEDHLGALSGVRIPFIWDGSGRVIYRLLDLVPQLIAYGEALAEIFLLYAEFGAHGRVSFNRLPYA